MMNDLQSLTLTYGNSVNNLRRIAHEQCFVSKDAGEWLLDLWLYERLAWSANYAGPHFNITDDDSVIRMISYSLMFEKGTFEQRCRTSRTEIEGNPIVRREITLPWRYAWRDTQPLWSLDDSQSFHESGGEGSDVIGFLLRA